MKLTAFLPWIEGLCRCLFMVTFAINYMTLGFLA
jgi:hypothetical protein